MATAALGVCSQLKGCSSASGAGVPVEFLNQDTTTMAIIADAVDGWVTFATHVIVMMVFTICKLVVFTLGCSVLMAGFTFLVLGPLTWRDSIWVRWLERRLAPRAMGWRHRLWIYPSLQISRWLLEQEIVYLRMRFRAAGQRGDMMIDLESIHADLVEYLGGERIRADEPRQPGQSQHPDVVLNEEEGEEEDVRDEGGDDPPDDGDDPNGDNIVHAALNGVPLNGLAINQPPNYDYENEDEDEEMPEETPEERRIRYQNSSQDEVSDPDEWATLHYGHLDDDENDRMLAFSRANRIRLARAANTLRQSSTQLQFKEIGRKLQECSELFTKSRH
eukprot:s1403_g9.t1